jgi:hypothetical protein
MSAIELAMRADDEAVRADLDDSPVDAPAAAVEETFFVVPTRLAVDGIELLTYPGVYDGWRPLPLLGFAPRLRNLTTGLRAGKAATLSLRDGGHLEFRRDGTVVVISSSLTGDDAAISVERLADAAVNFSADVCAYLLSLIPAMAGHTSWESWCAGPPSIARGDR